MSRHKGFPGGAVLPDDKDLTEGSGIEEIPAGPTVQMVLDDGSGGTAEPTVTVGQAVACGQCIGDPQSDDGVSVHSSVSGVVRRIEPITLADGSKKAAVVIDTDPEGQKDFVQEKNEWKVYSEGLIKCLRWAGIIQMSCHGGSLVARIRRALKAGLQWVIVNGVESEPLITAEARLMSEYSAQIARGCELLAEILGVVGPATRSSGPRGLLALCGHRHEALRNMREALKGGRFRLAVLADVYPQDEEVLLADTLARAGLRATHDATDVGVLVINVSSVWALSRAWYDGQPVTKRVITVSGDGTEKIGNYLVRIGTKAEDVLNHVGVLPEACRYIVGGPFRGWGRTRPRGLITKQTTGLTVLSKAGEQSPEACIRCGWCTEDCPAQIDPVGLYRMIEADRVDKAQKAWLEECIECGLCSYVCPSHLPLLERIRMGKWALRHRKQDTWQTLNSAGA